MKRTEKTKIACPSCGSKDTIKHGKQDGLQKYKCKNYECKTKYFFLKKREGYSDREKKFLSMLINFLNDKGDKRITIQEAVAKIDVKAPEISKFRLKQREQISDDFISCYNPRILICEDNKNISIYRFQERTSKDGESRKITIIDSDEQKDITYY